MACIRLYDLKTIGYQAKDPDDYMVELGGAPALKELLVHGDVVIDTKGELATYKILNSTRRVDERNKVIRTSGSIKVTKNFDSALFDSHKDLIDAGLGEFLSTGAASGGSILTGGTGASDSKFTVKSGSDSPVEGQLIHIPGYGVRVVTNASGGLTVDRPIDETISGEKAISILDTYSLHNPKGTCNKSFNVVVANHNITGETKEYIVAMGCNCMIDFSLNFDKLLTVSITFNSPDIYVTDHLSCKPTYTYEIASEPWVCNFDESIYIASDNHETPYFPQSIELGLTHTEEVLKYIGGGRNYVRGYLNIATIKPVFKLDIDTVGKMIRTACLAGDVFGYSFKQSQFALYMSKCQGSQVDHVINNNNHDAMSINIDANHLADSKIMLGIF